MPTPGFTAEVSIYPSRQSYRGAGAGATRSTRVVPQMLPHPRPWCVQACQRYAWSGDEISCLICDLCTEPPIPLPVGLLGH
jgi:hypothetical protein